MIQCVHQLIGDALPIDYAKDVTHASNGIECPNALDDGVDLPSLTFTCRRWVAWMCCGRRALPETRLLSP
jgi:hypothetical protein